MNDPPVGARRFKRAIADTASLRDVRPTLLRAGATAFLSLLIFGLTDYPKGALGLWLGLLTLVMGFALVVGLEFGMNLLLADGRNSADQLRRLQPELEELRANRADVESLRRQGEEQHAAYVEQIQEMRRTLANVQASHAANTEVLWGVLREQDAGVKVPLDAILARLEMTSKAKGVDMPDRT